MPHKDPAVRREYLRQWREAHVDYVKAEKKKHRSENLDRYKERERNRYATKGEHVRDGVHAYYRRNRQKVIAWNREYRDQRRSEIRAKQRARYRKDPQVQMTCNEKRRAIKKGAAVGTDRKAYRTFRRIVRYAPLIGCYWCGRILRPGERQVDHIIPLARKGPDDVLNLCCSCKFCNLSKGDKLPEDFNGQYLLPFITAPLATPCQTFPMASRC